MNNETYRILVTTYAHPDLDGVASAFAYAEFLTKTGKNVSIGYYGEFQAEAVYLINKYNVEIGLHSTFLSSDADAIILVDASDPRGISCEINPVNVLEVIDHRKHYRKEDFQNAKFNIELVGAAATLIAEKFFESGVDISFSARVLLFFAIISNTINFRANVTTDRDIAMAAWLEIGCEETQNTIKEMFKHKTESIIVEEKYLIEKYGAFFGWGETALCVIQLEIVDAESFIATNKLLLQSILASIMEKQNISISFVTIVDIDNARNLFVAQDCKSISILESCLSVTFDEGVSVYNGVLMRKELVPVIINVVSDKNDVHL